MSIVFHCNHCGKKIEAKEAIGGQWRNCPACKNKVYVPSIVDEEIPLAPIDQSDDEKQRKLMAETYTLAQDILLEREAPNSDAVTVSQSMSDENLTKTIITYLRQMADGLLEEARDTAKIIMPFGRRAIEALEKIGVSEIPEPELADIPQRVLAGLIRTLRSEIG